MTCGKLYVQSCSLVWFLSTVYLAGTPQANVAGVKYATHSISNLVVQRPRIAGGTMTIPLDSTVKFVKSWSKDIGHNIIRLTYGSSNKNVVLRASSPQEREQWLAAITAALSVYLKSAEHVTTRTLPQRGVKMPTKMRKTTSRTTSNISTTSGPAMSSQRTSEKPSVTHAAPVTCSLRRMVRRNIPAAMQFFITVGQIIAAAS